MKMMMKVHVFDDGVDVTTHALTEFPVHIGRGEDCELRVKHRRASRRHARIERVEDGFVLVDEGSRNGVRRNGVRVSPLAPVKLMDGDRVAIGPVTFAFGICELAEANGFDPGLADRRAVPGSDGAYPHLTEMSKSHAAPCPLREEAVGRTTQLSEVMAFRSPLAALVPRRTPEPEPGSVFVSSDLSRSATSHRHANPAKRRRSPSVDFLLDGLFPSPGDAPEWRPEIPRRPLWIAGILSAVLCRVREAARAFATWLWG
jgi:pSer/pThr/pTyr-binding forkhead associated (FHA) protein